MTAAPLIAGAAELGLAFRATLLIGVAWMIAAMLRKAGASAAARHTAWLLGIAALLALPLFWWLVPPLRLPILRPEVATAVAAALPSQPGPAPAPAQAATTGAPEWSNVLFAAYLIGVVALLLRFAITRHLVSRLWRDAEPARGAAWQDLLSRVSREMRLSRRVEIRIARGPAMPMTWGTLAPKLLLPAESGAWPPDRRRLVLLHELAHVARRDSLSRSAASLACALYWFHPGAWLAARQMRLEQEYAADDRVLTAGAAARSYALSLLDLARRVGEESWLDHTAAMAGMCHLERRVVSITTPTSRERPGPAFLSAAAAIATFVMLAVAAGVPVRPLPALPDPIGTETALPATQILPMPAEDGFEPDAQLPGPTTVALRTEGPPQRVRDGFEAPPAAAPPPPQAVERAQAAEGQQVAPALGHSAPPAPSAATGRDGQDAPVSSRQLGPYGPPRPQPLAEERATDPRIPASLRRDNEGRRANAEFAGRRGLRPFPVQLREGGLWISPGLILGISQPGS